jgi:hypothetical protein
MQRIVSLITTCALISVLLATAGCRGGSDLTSADIIGNEFGSEPINDTEANEYKRAVVRCYKTGGTRVVKIMGQLRCY